jgi:hypothetical protein
MMKPTLLVGIALVVLGVAVLGYDHYTYTTTETVLQIGSLKATAEKTHTVEFPQILGWLFVGGGLCVLAFAALSKKS